MTKHDKDLLDIIMLDKERYTIRVDNDAVWVEDSNSSEGIEEFWEGFDDYGWHFIISIFEYLGFESTGV